MPTKVSVTFETKATHRFLLHKGNQVALDAAGKGSFTVQDNEPDLILFGIQGNPGTTATITLSVPAGRRLLISGHPIKKQVAQNRGV